MLFRTTFRPLCLSFAMAVVAADAAWESNSNFRVEQVAGKPCLVAPGGEPFKSVGVVWAYGPEAGPHAGPLTADRVREHLALIQSLGFNTLNLYGDRFIPEMLDWCDEHELGVYFRTSYYSLPDFPGDLRQYPDFMDPDFRARAKAYYEPLLQQIAGHPSVLAIDMDHRWLFQLEWGGAARFDVPKLREHGVRFFPRWLETRYAAVDALNAARGTDYPSFAAVLEDTDLLAHGAFLSLTNHPLRVDVVRYTLWTAEDFLAELASHLTSRVPVIVTPTTEHPECIPECSPPVSSGIAFMSPVHYNAKADFLRDPASLCKLIYETRWHYDMQGGPAYISETGWRTDPLEQDPPNLDYAWVTPPSEEQAARQYATQFALLNVLPWVSGYGYFKLYDKVPEGDFGYLRDDGSKKPMALVGDAINRAFDTAALPDPAPEVWIYHPDHALATHRPGFQQLKSWVAVREKPFLDSLERRVDEHWAGLSSGDRQSGAAFARDVTADFQSLWRGYAFARRLPADDKPIVLFSTISQVLSAEDRQALAGRKTISFGEVGACDDAFRPTMPWSLETLGLAPEDAHEQMSLLDMNSGKSAPVGADVAARAQGTNLLWQELPPADLPAPVRCAGQSVALAPARYKRLDLLAGSTEGNAAPFLDVTYTDGTTNRIAMGPTISDIRYAPGMTPGFALKGRQLSHLRLDLQLEKELKSIRLPNAPWVTLYGAALVRRGAVTAPMVSLVSAAGAVRGRTPRMLDVEPRADWQILQRSALGDPLIVARGPHVVYLYDPLTWAGREDEVSRFVDAHAEHLEKAFQYLREYKLEQ